MEITAQNRRLFRSGLPGWQEAYMNRLNQEYMTILTGEATHRISSRHWKSASSKARSIPVFSLNADVLN